MPKIHAILNLPMLEAMAFLNEDENTSNERNYLRRKNACLAMSKPCTIGGKYDPCNMIKMMSENPNDAL